MESQNFLAGNQSLNFDTVVESIVKRSCIIDFGIVQSIPAKGLVNVSVAVSDTEQNMFCMTCVLASIASSSFTLDLLPNVGDRVLVVYPRLYDNKMFTVTDNEDDNKKVIVNQKAKGYNLMSGIAILMNQYKTDGHMNVLKIEDGKMSLNLAYDKDNDKHKFTITTDEDGAYSIKNEKSIVTVDADGYLSYSNTDDGKTKLTFTSSGFTLQDKNECKIVSSSSDIQINGKLKVNK